MKVTSPAPLLSVVAPAIVTSPKYSCFPELVTVPPVIVVDLLTVSVVSPLSGPPKTASPTIDREWLSPVTPPSVFTVFPVSVVSAPSVTAFS